MGIVAELPRSSELAWAPSGTGAMLAAAPAADIFDASFDAGGRLELLALDVHAPALRLRAAAPCPERAHAVAWGAPSTSPGLVAAALEGGAVTVWDAAALLRLPLSAAADGGGGGTAASAAAAATVVSAGAGAHAGAARAVEWNPRVPTLLASAGDDGHVLVWDFGRGAAAGGAVTPLTPVGVAPSPPGVAGADAPAGAAPAKEAMLCVGWNRQMQQILAGGGAAGVTAVWDLRQKRRVIALRHPRGRLTCSGLAWSPTVATQLLTASAERGALLWDLRNATAPLRSLRHHRAGIADVSWCLQDAGLLLTAGHDGATSVVDPASGDVLSNVSHVGGGGDGGGAGGGGGGGAGGGNDGGDTDSLDGGVVRGDFGVAWNPRLPGVFATASRDGRIAVQSLLTASVASSVSSATASALSTAFGGEFVSGATAESPRVNAAVAPGGALMARSPVWLARRACLTFGPCGRPVAVVHRAAAKGASPTSVVRLHPRVQTEEPFVSAALALERDIGGPDADLASLAAYCDEKAENVGEDGGDDGPVERASWALLALQLRPNARQQLLTHLGFSVPAAAAAAAAAADHGVIGLAASPPLCTMSGDVAESGAAPLSPPPTQDDGYPHQSPARGVPLSPVPTSATPQLATNLDGPAPWDMPDAAGGAPPTVSGLGSILDADPAGASANSFGDGGGGANGETPSAGAKGDTAQMGGEGGDVDVLSAANINVEDAAAVDLFVSRAVLVGDFAAAVDASLRTGRYADALLLARRGGDDLWHRAADAVMGTSPPPAPTAALAAASAAVAGHVSLERAADWRDALAAAVTFSGGLELSASARAIAAQIVEGKDASLSGDAAAEAAVTCYIAAGDTAAAAGIWLSSLSSSRTASRLPELTAAVAKIRLLSAAVCAGRGETHDLGSVRALDATSTSALVAFGRTLAAAGQPGLAVAYFANIESAADDADLARNAAVPAYAPEPAAAEPAAYGGQSQQYGQPQQPSYGQPQAAGFGQPSQPGFGQPPPQAASAGYGRVAGGFAPAGQFAGSGFASSPGGGGFGAPAANGFANGPPQDGGANYYGAPPQPSTPVRAPAFQPPPPPIMAPTMPMAPPQSFGSPAPPIGMAPAPPSWGAPAPAAPTLPPMPLAPAAAAMPAAPPAGGGFGGPPPQFGQAASPAAPAFPPQQPAYTQPTMPAMPTLPPPMPSFGSDAAAGGGFGSAPNAMSSMPPTMSGGAPSLPPPPPPPPPSDGSAASGGAAYNPNARARVGGDGGRPRLPPSAEVAGIVRRPAGTPGAPGAPGVGMSRSSSASSALGALSVTGSEAGAGGGGGKATVASFPAVAVDAADVSAVPREQAAIPRALCGAFSYTAQLSAAPVFRRKMDDVSRKLGRLLSALNAGAVDASVVTHLLRLAGALEKGDYDEAAAVVQVLTREHWDEHGSWIQALQRLIQSARTGR